MASSARSLLTVNALVLAALAVGFLNNVAIAALFGLSRRIDAYYAALMLPGLFMSLCIDYLGKNFLPMLAQARRESYQLASELTSSVVTIVAVFAAAVALLLVLVSAPLFDLLLPGFDEDEIVLVSRYFTIMAPALVLSAVTAFHEYVCQHDEEYSRITAIRAALPLTNLVTIVAAGPFIGEYALPAGYTLGQVVVSFMMGRRARYDYAPRMTVRPQWERKIFTNSAIVMGSGLLVRTRGIIGTYLSSQLGAGAISALALASRLTELIERGAFTGVRMLMFSRMARLDAKQNTREVARLYELGLSASFLVLAPIVWWVGVNSSVLVGTLFQRGAFDAQMTAIVSLALIGFLPSLVFLGVNALMSNAFYAMDRVKIPAAVMPIGTVVYLVFAPTLIGPFGVLGLALSTGIVAAVVFAILLYFLAKQIPELRANVIVARLAGYAALAGASMLLPAAALDSVQGHGVLKAAADLGIGTLLYVAVLAALRDRTLSGVYEYLLRALPRRASAGGTLP